MKSILVIGLFMAIFCVGTSIGDGRGEHDEDDEGITVGNTVLKVSKNGKIVIYKNVPEKGMPDVSDGDKPEGGKPDGDKPKGGKPDGDKPDKGGEHGDKPGGGKGSGEKGPKGKGPGGKGKKPRKTPAIEISMAEIKPRKMEGEGKKEMRDFAKQVFTLSAPVNTTVLNSGVAAVEVSATTTLAALNNTDLKFIIHIIKENGTITIGDEVQEVTVGMVKFSLEVSGGDWNDDMIVGLHLKSKGKPHKRGKSDMRGPPPPENKKRAPEFSLGGDSFMQMSELVKVDDGAWQTQCMGADNTTYPLVKERGNMQIMIFCLPQFTSKAIIDPTFEAGNEAEPEDDENAATNVALSLVVLLLSSLIATLGW